MKDNFYITTSIAYTNAKPHIGFALESVQADAMARWNRLQGRETFFLTGTDEHGVKIKRAAFDAGKSVKEFVDELSDNFKGLKEALDLSWDQFIRTSDKKNHWPGAQALWRKLEESGDIYWKEYKGLYCVGCENFVTEKDLVDGKCPDHKKEPEEIEEKNLFFRLSKYGEKIAELIKSGELEILPEGRRNEILSFIEGGLEDVSFSRSKDKLDWGIPVPGHEDQVMYVWCDALSNYISAIGYGRDEKNFEKWWPAEIHVIGKDILRFHAAIWPGMLLAAGIPLPKKIFVHGFVTAEGEKISKSIGNVIDPYELVEKYGTDPVRYYLLRDLPSDEDGDFSTKRFEERYNADLANGLGNFASRITTLAESVGDLSGQNASEEVLQKIKQTAEQAALASEKFKLHETVSTIWSLIKFGDGYINENKPWEDSNKEVIYNGLHLLHAISKFIDPIIPESAEKIRANLKMDGDKVIGAKKIENLFPRLNA